MPLPTNATDPNQEFLGTKGLVFIGDQVLVYRRDAKAPRYPLAIDVPGGGREGRESPAETFMREIKEEFGLGIAVDDISYSRRYRASDGSDNYG
jgi:8-oxo-dGTP diphosphatase